MKNQKKILREILVKEFGNEQIIKLHEETIHHLYRCFDIAEEFGFFLKLSEDKVKTLSECALLHDLGKFQVDTNILYKTTFLTEKEFEIIKSHVDYKPKSDLCEEVLNCIKYHHERPDNNGYTESDYSKVLPFTKIVSIIDTFDVISNKRCYKSLSLNLTGAIEEIKKNIGVQFNEYYGELFIKFLETKIKSILKS